MTDGIAGEDGVEREDLMELTEEELADLDKALRDDSLGKGERIRMGLIANLSRDALVNTYGFSKSSVDSYASQIKSEIGSTDPVGKTPGTGVVKQTRATRLQATSKGLPAECLIESIQVPPYSTPGFEPGMKFGMSILVMAVRIMQEMASVGAQQARPLLELAKDMRSGEAAAAKAASLEAANAAADGVASQLAPYLTQLADGQKSMTAPGTDPMRAMMAKSMSPMLDNMTNMMTSMMARFAPGMEVPGMGAPGQVPMQRATDSTGAALPPGWSHRSE